MELQTRLGDADLIQPNRVFIKEGEFSDITKAGREQVLSLFLFSDVLIVTTGKQCHKIQLVAAKVAVSRHLILLYRVDGSHWANLRILNPQVSVPNAVEFPLDFSIKSTVRSFSLRAKSESDRELWVSALQKAVEENKQRLQESYNKLPL